MTLEPLPPGPHGLLSARAEPDLVAAGYEEREYLFATDVVAHGGSLPPATAVTRVVVRRPVTAPASGTLLVEWFNVSSGADAAPDWTFAWPEILRQGHAWAGVSAQHVGVEGGRSSVAVEGAPSGGLRAVDADRFGDVHHPGDAYSYDLFTRAAVAARDLVGAARVLAVGESQSAAALVTYANDVHGTAGVFDGFLVHSRPGAALPLVPAGVAVHMDEVIGTAPVLLRDDLDVPVLVVQAEGDLFDRIAFLPARQPDTPRRRTWEVAGAAHADRYVIGEFESLLGSPVPVNNGQQWAVVRAAVRALDVWVREGVEPPSADPLELTDGADDCRRDEHGIALGGVRSPAVDAPADVVSGRPWPGSSTASRLFGSTTPLPSRAFPTRAAYLAAYERAADAMVGAGFACGEDRDALLAEARVDHPAPDDEHDDPEGDAHEDAAALPVR